MGLREYRESMGLAADGSFYGLVMAAMRNADTQNLAKLQAAFPQVWEELKARYNAPGGCLTEQETQWLMRVIEERDEQNEDDNDN